MSHGPATNLNPPVLRHAFVLLAGAELERVPDWSGPDDPSHLLTRVELLAVLLNVIPRSELHRLDAVAENWLLQFPAGEVATVQHLRVSARSVLQQSDGNEAEPKDADSATQFLQQIFGMPVGKEDRKASRSFSEVIRKRCVEVLDGWATQVKSEPEWRTLPNVVPGEQRTPIEQVYVDLTTLPKSGDGSPSVNPMRPERVRRQRDEATVDVGAMVSQTFRACVVLGEPGSGKSTMFQWLVWATYERKLRDFDVAVAIRLRQYAEALRQRPQLSLLEFFFERTTTQQPEDKTAGDCLRQAAVDHGRFLLLLDGWDEVPSADREAVSRAVQREREGFVVVLTSRISGSPWEIFPSGQADYYEISGLSSGAIRDFVEKQLSVLGRSELVTSIMQRMETGDELRGLTSNPFLLGLLVRVLCLDVNAQTTMTRASLYEQITQWIVDQQRTRSGTLESISGEHLRALERLSHQLIFQHESPQYVFPRSVLDKELQGASAEPVIQSRFIHRLDPVYDCWSFLHATFEEYFAARQMATLSGAELNETWERSLSSQARLVTLGFFAGMCETNFSVVRELAEKWLDAPDRFDLVLLRLTRVACFGSWLDIEPGFVSKLEDRLWKRITSSDDWLAASFLLEAFAELDPPEVLRLATQLDKGDSRIWESLCNCVPAEIVRGSALYERLPKPLRDVVATRGHSPDSSVDPMQFVAQLTDRTQPIGEFLRVLDQAACVPERPVAEAMLVMLQEAADEKLEVSIIMALSRIYDCLPTQRSLEILVGDYVWPATLRRIASTALSHSQRNDGMRLAPQGRDRLLRRLAAFAPTDPRVDNDLLAALRGYPIRDGGRLIAELAVHPSVEVSVRAMAPFVLQTVSDQEAVQATVLHVMKEPSLDIQTKLLELAVVRHISLPREWLETRIEEERHSWRRGTLTAAYVHATNLARGGDRDAYRKFLSQRIEQTLSMDTEDTDVMSHELASAFTRLGPSSWVWAHERFQKPAYRFLERYVGERIEASAGQVRLATTLLRFVNRPREKELLHDTLKELLRRIRHEGDRRSRLEIEAQAGDVARIVADVAVGRLLTFPSDCAPVRDVLAERSRELGWLVFEDRILDANGREIANLHRVQPVHSEVNHEAVRSLVDGLAEAKRSAILSRWLVVQLFKLQLPTAPEKAIYQCVEQTAAGENEARATELVQELYPEGIPPFELWRQYMYRAAKDLRAAPDGLAFLRGLGLGQSGRRRR